MNSDEIIKSMNCGAKLKGSIRVSGKRNFWLIFNGEKIILDYHAALLVLSAGLAKVIPDESEGFGVLTYALKEGDCDE
mgnify:CR=1 FL=1